MTRNLALALGVAALAAASVVSAQSGSAAPGPGMGWGCAAGAPASGGCPGGYGWGNGPGPGYGRGYGAGSGQGTMLLTADERIAFRDAMHAAKTLDECKALVAEHRQLLEQRAQDRGIGAPPGPRVDMCERMKAHGFVS